MTIKSLLLMILLSVLPISAQAEPSCIPVEAALKWHKDNKHQIAGQMLSERGYILTLWTDKDSNFYLTGQAPGAPDMCMLDKGTNLEVLPTLFGGKA
jgi:hypothetical protein